MRGDDFERDDENEGLPDFLRDPLGVLPRHWIAALIGLGLGVCATATLVSRFEPIYSSTASILVTSQGIPEYLVRSTVRDDPFARLNAMVGRVLTNKRLAALVEEFDLYPDLAETKTLSEVVSLMGANIATWVDTLLAALLLDSPRGFEIVLTQMLAGGIVSLLVLVFVYGPYTRLILGVAHRVSSSRRSLAVFLASLILAPLVLLAA